VLSQEETANKLALSALRLLGMIGGYSRLLFRKGGVGGAAGGGGGGGGAVESGFDEKGKLLRFPLQFSHGVAEEFYLGRGGREGGREKPQRDVREQCFFFFLEINEKKNFS
jgi:hypothetical protein